MSTSEKISKTFESLQASDSLPKMYKNAETADVYFTFELSERIPAHKCVLAQSSDVFHKMFFGGLRETGDVLIDDVNAEAFDEFLQFFYLPEVTLTNVHIAEVLYLTNKYDLVGSSVICVEFFKQILNAQTMCWGYELAVLYDLKELRVFCENDIAFDATSIFKSKSFENCSRHILKRILSMDNLNCTEIEVFNACMKWAEFSNNKRIQTWLSDSEETSRKRRIIDELTSVEQQMVQLEDCFNLIRFPTMNAETFSKCLENRDGILSSDEVADIKRHIAQGCPLKVAKRFNCNERLWILPKWSMSDKTARCDRHEFGSEPEPDDKDEFLDLVRDGSFTFSSNRRIVLGALGAERLETFKSRHEFILHIKLEIWKVSDTNSDTNDDYMSAPEPDQMVSSCLKSISSGSATLIELNEPIIINPYQNYEIRIALMDDLSHSVHIHAFFERDKKKVSLGNGIGIEFRLDKVVALYGTGSVISRLYFNEF